MYSPENLSSIDAASDLSAEEAFRQLDSQGISESTVYIEHVSPVVKSTVNFIVDSTVSLLARERHLLNDSSKRSLFENGISLLEQVAKTEAFGVLKKQHPDSSFLNENLAKRPLTDIIDSGIAFFRERFPEARVTYYRRADYIDTNDFMSILGNTLRIRTEDNNVSLKEILVGDKNLGHLKTVFNAALPESVHARIRTVEDYSAPVLNEHTLTNINNFESWVLTQEKPISMSYVIAYCLEQTSGDLSLALERASFYIKHITKSGASRPGKYIGETFLDEFSQFNSFNNTRDLLSAGDADLLLNDNVLGHFFNKVIKGTVVSEYDQRKQIDFDISINNQVGKLYHVMDLLSLLNQFPPELLALMTSYEYFSFGDEHGLCKLHNDIDALSQLYKVQTLLDSYFGKDIIS